MAKYKQRLKLLYPNYTDEKLEEIYQLRLEFWKWLVENFDLFYKSVK